LELLRRERFNFAGNDPKAGLLVMPTSSMYYPRGYFSPDEMFEQWQRLYEASREEGYKRFRVTGETSWLKTGLPGAERFVEYEVKLDTALDKYPITVLCQYNTQLFHGGELTDLINAHPFIISNGQLLRNHFYDLLAEVGLSAGSLEIVTPRLKTELSRQVDALFLTAALVLATLPIRQKIEYSERLLARLIGQGKFHFCLGGLMCDSTILACPGSKTRNVCPCCSLRNNPDFISYEIKTTESFYGYLLLERSVDEACRALRPSLVNYLNLLAFSIENDRQKQRLQTLNLHLQQEIISRKKTEKLLRENDEWTARILEGTDEGLWESDLLTGVIKYNKNWQKVLGYKPGEIIFTQNWLAARIHPEDLPLLEKALADYIEGQAQYYEVEYRIRTKTGEWKWVWSRGIALSYGADNKPIKLGGTIRDITVHRETEEALRVSKEKLAAAKKRAEALKIQKLESLGILAGGIAHDFNNLLAAILAHVQLADLKLQKGLDGRQNLQTAEKLTMEASKLTRQLQAFTKGGLPVKQAAKLSVLLKETVKFTLCGKAVQCKFMLPAELWMVDIDNGQIGQVIQNIVLNACQAMPRGGVITIAATNEEVPPENEMQLKAGKYVKVEIKDEGMGIPEENLTKIFDPYFTTKEKGNGLGLASSYYILKNHGGFLGVRSKVGSGSTFYFYLPVTTAQPVPAPPKISPKSNANGRILIMDDQPMIRNSLREFLESCGHSVAVAKDGWEAVKLFKNNCESSTPFDLVILDLTIPGGMGGKEAGQYILALDPSAKVIVFSGYSDDPVLADHRKYGFYDTITKPFRFEDLSVKIENALHPSAPSNNHPAY
ncbi:MAG: response regulator, partial [Firmicutes bacterium]|nr:response regulator [Bacillota bacterium]